jgi:splicing factor 1
MLPFPFCYVWVDGIFLNFPGEILKLNPTYKVPPDYKPLLKETTVPIPVSHVWMAWFHVSPFSES